MKITPNNYKNFIKLYNDPQKITQSKTQEKNIDESLKNILPNRKDDVNISQDYQLHEKAMNELLAVDNKDNKIKSLAISVKNGTYKINSRLIAQKILEKGK